MSRKRKYNESFSIKIIFVTIIVQSNIAINQQKQTNFYDLLQKELDILSSVMFLSKNQHRRTKYFQHLQKV